MFGANSAIPQFLQITITLLITMLLILGIYYLIYIGNMHVNSERKIKIKWKNIFKLIGIAILISIIAAMFRKFPILGSTTFSLFVSVLIAYLLNPLINKLEQRRIPRYLGTILVYLLLVLVFVGLGFLVLPSLTKQISDFVNNLPQIVNETISWVVQTLNTLGVENATIYAEIDKFSANFIQQYSSTLLNWSTNLVTILSGSISKIISLILIPIITYFLLVDKDRIFGLIKENFPAKYYKEARGLYHEINEAMSAFVRGRILMAVFVGIATMIFLFAIRVEFAFVIGMITMIGDIIPYIGPFMGFLPAIIFALIQSPIKAIWVGAMFLFIQWVENNILAPKLLGKSTGIHPLIILISIIIGGGMFGVWGMILSVPFVSLIIILFKFSVKQNRKSKLLRERRINK